MNGKGLSEKLRARFALSIAQHPHAGLLLLDFLISPAGQKMFNETFAYGSGAKNYGFEKFYPEKGLTTEEYSERLEKWMRLMKATTRK